MSLSEQTPLFEKFLEKDFLQKKKKSLSKEPYSVIFLPFPMIFVQIIKFAFLKLLNYGNSRFLSYKADY